MFVCNKCLKCGAYHFSESYGRCEICEKDSKVCVDCPPSHWDSKNKKYYIEKEKK